MKLAMTLLAVLVATATVSAAEPTPSKMKAPATPTATVAPQPPPVAEPMVAPKPPAEVAAMAKRMAGTWKCTGNAFMGATSTPMSGKMTFKLDPGKFFIVGTWKSKKTKMMPAMVSTEYRTYDPATQKWSSVGIDNTMGSWSTSTAAAAGADGKTTWDGKMTGMTGMPGMAGKTVTVRTTESPGATAKQILLKAEMNVDGKTWMTAWDATCKK